MVSTETEPLAIYIEAGDDVKITYGDTGEQFLPVKEMSITTIKVNE